MKSQWSVAAPAKLNLTLDLLGLLPGGYHQLDSIFASLELADELSWQESEVASLTLTGQLEGLEISNDESNLVLRALRTLESACGRDLPLAIQLHKRIPAGGGLGGGSSDAAALLYGVNRSHRLGLSCAELLELASPLGADVAFGLLGGVARGRDRGQQLTALPLPPSRPLLLIFPPFFCPTGQVYACWDQLPARPRLAQSPRMVEALPLGPWEDYLGNDLTEAAESLQPALAEIRQAVLQRGWGPVLLCGSGSTLSCWGCPSSESLQELLQPWGCRVVATRLPGRPRSW